MNSLSIAVVGATGAVGRELLICLEESTLEVGALRLLAGARSAGTELEFDRRSHEVAPVSATSFSGCDLVFLATSSAVSRELAPAAAAAGACVIDNSRAFRSDPDVPLIVPELNAAAIRPGPGIMANPNCSTIIALMAAGPLAQKFDLTRMIASTYQAVSGAGAAGLDELAAAARADRAGSSFEPEVFTVPISENLIPMVGDFAGGGATDEELKMRDESRKILSENNLDVFCTCVRVSVKRAHSISLHASFARSVQREEILEVWAGTPGLTVVPDDRAAFELNPRRVEGAREVFCGRLRPVDDAGREWAFFVVGDQLLKGAAQNAVQIAESWAQASELTA